MEARIRLMMTSSQVQIRVHGDTVVTATPAWVGYLVLAVGALLVAGDIAFLVRLRRHAA